MYSIRPLPRALSVIASLVLLFSAKSLRAASWVRELTPAAASAGLTIAPHSDGAVIAFYDERNRTLGLAVLDNTGQLRKSSSFGFGGKALTASAKARDGGLLLANQWLMQLPGSGGKSVEIDIGEMQAFPASLESMSTNQPQLFPPRGQPFEALDRRIVAVCPGAGGGTFAAGELGREKSVVYSLGADGNGRWIKELDWTGEQSLAAIAASGDGVVVAGSASGQAIVARLDSGGAITWQHAIGRGTVRAIAAARDGGWLVAGSTESGGQDILVGKLSADGSPLWLRSYGSPSDEAALSIHESPRGSILVGAVVSSRRGAKAIALELSGDGNVIAELQMPPDASDAAGVAASADGSGELVFALRNGSSIAVARYDGANPRLDCATSSGLTGATMTASSASLPLEIRDSAIFAFPQGAKSGKDVEITASAAECGATPGPAASKATSDDYAKQRVSAVVFSAEIRTLFGEKRFDELEARAAELRGPGQTFPDGHWKLERFYSALGTSPGIDCPTVLAIYDTWMAAKPASPTPKIAAIDGALGGCFRGGDAKEVFAGLRKSLDSIDPGLRDPEYLALRMSFADPGDGLWQAFEKATAAFPDYFMYYALMIQKLGADRATIERVQARADAVSKGVMGDAAVFRIASAVQVLGGDREFIAQNWSRVQSGYRDYMKAFPESYRNMSRFELLACGVGDRRVAARIEEKLSEMHGAEASDTEFGDAPELVTACKAFAEQRPFEPWAFGAKLEPDQASDARAFEVKIPAEGDPALRVTAELLGWQVYPDLGNWPRVSYGRDELERVGISGADAGFFMRGRESKLYYVTASDSGRESVPPVIARRADGSSQQLQAIVPRDKRLRFSAAYACEVKGVKVLEARPVTPQPGSRMHVAIPRPGGQVVVTGAIRSVARDEHFDQPVSFDLVLLPGSIPPPAGSPVFDDLGYVEGVVSGISVERGFTIVRCEGASISVQ